VVHFVGDMHQPLHEEDNNDRGGNQVAISAADPRAKGTTNLHALWDEPLVVVALGSADLDKATTALAAKAAMSPTPAYADTAAALADSDQWAIDAHALATPAYALLHIPVGAGPRKTKKISAAYLQSQGAVVETQLTLAAVRLRAVLNTALTWTPPPAAPTP
jgi:S1/P1 Nuclease